MIPRFFITIEVPLQFGIDIFLAENINKSFGNLPCARCISLVNPIHQRSIAVSRQANQSVCIFSEFIERDSALTRLRMLRHPQLHQRDQPAKILITATIANEERQREGGWSNRTTFSSKVQGPRSNVSR